VIDFSLTEEQLLIQRTARDFAQNELKPVAVKLDKNQDPAKTVIPLDLYKKAGELGFTKMTLPQEYGGPELGNLDLVIVLEELATADCGFGAIINMENGLIRDIAVVGTEEQRKRWLGEFASEDYVLLAMGALEPAGGGATYWGPDPSISMKTYAKRDGDSYVINGTKHAFVTGAGQAKYYQILARTDLTKPQFQDISRFIVPADTPGFSVGKAIDKIGWRGAPHCELYLDNVRIPRDYLIGGEGKSEPCTGVNVVNGTGAFAVGVARAAFEYARDYAKRERVIWGKPLVQHQAVAMMLAEMQTEIQVARLLVWQSAWLDELHRDEPDFVNTLVPMQKVFATDMAVRVTQKAIEVLGCYGLCTDFPLERYHREALACMIACDHRNRLLLRMASEFGYVPA
jgi:alkylation response protein AidB-like acyl-CoA dehydrogenase